jgi:putative ABC transport system permease protein
LLFSVAPARRALKADVVAVLRRTDGRLERRWRNILMSTQLAIALMLVIVGMQMVRSCARLQNQERGFQPDDVLTARIAVPEARYPTAATRADFFRRLLAQARQLPDTAEAAAVQLLPLRGVASLRSVARPDQVSDNMPSAFHFVVSPRYFETLTIPLLVGRTFNDLDTRSRARVVILSRAAAERYFPNENPIGRKLWIKDGMNADWKVIGIVGDIRNQRLDRAPQPQIYVPLDQNPTAVMTVVLRSHDHNPLALARPFRDVVHALDVEQGVSDVRLMTQVVDDSVARWRVPTNLFVAFGSVAVLLALFGLYSITTFTVAMRSREIAVRVALGGSRRSVVGLLMRSIAVLCGAGVGVGLMVSVAVARALSSLLFAVTPVDAIPFGLASVAFATLVLGTGAWTACRTTDMQPADVLKMD